MHAIDLYFIISVVLRIVDVSLRIENFITNDCFSVFLYCAVDFWYKLLLGALYKMSFLNGLMDTMQAFNI